MENAIHKNLISPPKLPLLFSKTLFSKALKPVSKKSTLTDTLSASVTGVKINQTKLKRYTKICGFTKNQDILPSSFLHTIAFPIHIHLMTTKEFPYSILGLIHTKNTITQYRPIDRRETLDIYCFLSADTPHEKGEVFCIKTQVKSGDCVVWESTSTLLKRHRLPANPDNDSANNHLTLPTTKPKQHHDKKPYKHETIIDVKSNTGMRYAFASGDFNPIHLNPVSAKLFGFNRAIAHGMWSKALILAKLEPSFISTPFTIDISFKKPLTLPSKVRLCYTKQANHCIFKLCNMSEEKNHLTGLIRESSPCQIT